MGFFDRLRRAPQPEPESDPEAKARLQRRLQMGPTNEGGVVDTTLRDKLQRKMEMDREVSALTEQFAVMLENVERIDQYLPTLEKLLTERHASPEVIRRVAKNCQEDLERFFQTRAGSATILAGSYERRPQNPADARPTRLVPEAFGSRSQLDHVRVLANDMMKWTAEFIHRVPPDALDVASSNK